VSDRLDREGRAVSARIGIDVGGTNTDAVVMRGGEVAAWAKVPTTADVTTGIVAALGAVLEPAQPVAAVMIGTTHFTNAVAQREGLEPVAVLRLGAPATESLPPLVDWPEDLAQAVLGHCEILPGGHEFDGRELTPLNEGTVRHAARSLRAADLRLVALSAVFSPIDPSSELRAAAILSEELPEAEISLSHLVGGRIGLLERENATVLNAALLPLGRRTIETFEQAVADAGVEAPLYVTQNDGTVMSAGYAARHPVLTFASGPSNSMRGAAYLSGTTDGFVVDVGGTTTDVGALRNGWPRPAALGVEVGGVRTSFRMPDVVSIALGGGSVVGFSPPRVGPRSVGYGITEEAWVFGGRTPTATDVAVAFGRGQVGDFTKLGAFDPMEFEAVLEEIDDMLDAAVDRMRTRADAAPVVAVGGGSFLVPDDLAGASEVVRPQHASVANAVGAAIAQVSGEVDRVVSLDDKTRAQALEECRQEAIAQAEEAGAAPGSADIVDEEEVPLAYLPSNATRIRMKAVGDAVL
jgi:N-methylhydantoinase A/oxoprolinase/acetone carboxylase beta subunit